MDDLISRKQAVDALRKMQTYKLFSGDDMLLIDQAGAQTELMLLPPAQPEQLGTNLAQLGTDCISRQAAIEALYSVDEYNGRSIEAIRQLPSAQPEIIRCRECKFASGDSRICMKFGHSPIGELDFCAWAERRTDEE